MAEEEKQKAPKKAPASYRAGSALGRHADTATGLYGGAIGAGVGAYSKPGTPVPARLASMGVGAGLGYLAGRGIGRFGQGLSSGASHAYGDTGKTAAMIPPALFQAMGDELEKIKEAAFGAVPARSKQVLKSIVGHRQARKATTDRAAAVAGKVKKPKKLPAPSAITGKGVPKPPASIMGRAA